MMKFSVLMSVYGKDEPIFLKEALLSVINQTLEADQIVLVKDGPLNKELDDVIRAFPSLTLVELSQNVGLGRALNEGLQHCSNELVVRMDSDDICFPERFAHLISFMVTHPDISACSSWIDEFIETKENVVSSRKLPEFHEELVEYARKRNPLNHPAVVFRKSDVNQVGGYKHFPLYEDYFLWMRLIANGLKLHNLQESLLWFRTSVDMYKRRGGWKYAKTSAQFQWELRRMGVISTTQAIKSSIIRGTVFLIPNQIRGWIYKHLLR